MTRLRGMVRRGAVKRVDEARKMRELQLHVGVGDLRDRVEHFEPYGLTSAPLDDAEAIVVTVGGDRAHSVAVVVSDRRARPLGLGRGDVAVYAADGARAIFRRGGGIEITSSSPVSITAPELRVNGDIKVTGNIQATGNVADGTRTMAEDRVIFNTHTHPGVQTGSGTSGPPLQHQ